MAMNRSGPERLRREQTAARSPASLDAMSLSSQELLTPLLAMMDPPILPEPAFLRAVTNRRFDI